MAIDFPSTPSTSQTHTHNGLTWKYDGTSWILQTIVQSSDFLTLSDTPSSYTGQGGKYIKVNSTPDGLEFVDAPVIPSRRFTTLNSRTNTYNLQASDIWKTVKITSPGGGVNLQLGIPDLSSSLSFGDEVRILNGANETITVTASATTLYWAQSKAGSISGGYSTGNRQIYGYALVTLTYVGNNTWNIHGDGVF